MKLLATLLAAACTASSVDFSGHKVLRARLPSSEQGAKHAAAQIELLVENGQVDLWRHPRGSGDFVDVRVAPEHLDSVRMAFGAVNAEVSVMIDDVAEVAAAQLAPAETVVELPQGMDKDWHLRYHDLSEVERFCEKIVAKFPSLITRREIGRTTEDRPIYALEFSAPSEQKEDKPVFLFDGGIHAREWISPATMQYFLDRLANGYGVDKEVTSWLDRVDIVVIPVLNPDGYAYTHSTNRMWRKNRAVNEASRCMGVDLCRNGKTGFGGKGSSGSPCMETFRGESYFSEPETASWAEYLLSFGSRIKAYINFHAYSEVMLQPWGYTATPPADFELHQKIGQQCADSIEAVHGKKYRFGSAYTVIYPASGVISDWAYDPNEPVNAKHAYAFELRDTGKHGFLLPADQIIPQGEEIWPCLGHIIDDIAPPQA